MTIQKKFSLSLLVSFVCGVMLLAGACNRDPQVQKQKRFGKAVEFLKKGNFAKAQIELHNALKLDPNFVEAANVLAELDARQGNYREAYVLLQRAEKAKPDYLPVRKGLVKLYRLSGKVAEAQEEIEFILNLTPDDTDTLFDLGTLQISQKKLADAEGTFNRILEIQPGHVRALLALASVRQQSQDATGAERYLRLALERNPRSVAVYLSLIKFLVLNHRPEVEAVFAQALKVSDNNVEILEAEEGYYEGLGRTRDAEAVAGQIQSLHPNDPRFWGARADFYIRSGNWAQAQTELESILVQHKGDPSTLRKLIELHLDRGDRKAAEALNEALLKQDPKDAHAHLFKGRLDLAAGRPEDALSEFNQTRQFEPDFAAVYYWMAQAYQQRRTWRLALQDLQIAVRLDPNYQTARMDLGRLQMQTGAVDLAMTNARALFLKHPENLEALLLYSRGLLVKHQYADAEKIIKAAAARGLDSSELHRQMGILSLVRNDLPAAQSELQKAWTMDPGSKPVMEALLMSYLANRQPGVANDFLQRQLQARAQDPLLYHELAQLYLVLGKQNEAMAALEKARSLDPSNPDTALLLAELYTEAKQPEQATRIALDLVQKHQQDADVLLRAGMVLEKVQLWDNARQAYERAVQLDDDNVIAKNNLAWLLVSHGGNVDVALTLAQQAKEKMSDDVEITDTLGWIYYQKKVYRTALYYLKECAAKEQNNASFQFQLGMTYLKLGEVDQARRALISCLRLDPHSSDAPAARQTLATL